MFRVSRRKAAQIAIGASIPDFAAVPLGGVEADEILAALIAEHHRFDATIQAAEHDVDALRAADRLARRTMSARVDEVCARLERLHQAQGRVANAIINLPASSFVGVAYKLILWRREAAIMFPDDFDAAHESFTFSAYCDVLRLTGLEAQAHKHDQATRARMRKYWTPS